MINIIPSIASHHSRRKSSAGMSRHEQEIHKREGEIMYGEICCKCETYIGDPTGFERVCDNCPPLEIKENRKKKWWNIFG